MVAKAKIIKCPVCGADHKLVVDPDRADRLIAYCPKNTIGPVYSCPAVAITENKEAEE